MKSLALQREEVYPRKVVLNLFMHIKLFPGVLNRELAMVPAGDESIVNSVSEKPACTGWIA